MPGDDEHPFAGHLDKARIISRQPSISTSMSGLEQPTAEALGGLDRAQEISVNGDDNLTLIVDALDRVDKRHARNDCRVAGMDSSRDGRNEFSRNKGPCGVVHEDNLDVVRQRKQRQ